MQTEVKDVPPSLSGGSSDLERMRNWVVGFLLDVYDGLGGWIAYIGNEVFEPWILAY